MQKIRDIARRCRLAQPFEQWCIAYAATASWKEVHPSLRELLAHTFSGWIQSRINEKANKVWRDAALRNNVSQKVALTSLWELLTSGGVIEEFERDDIQDDGEGATEENQVCTSTQQMGSNAASTPAKRNRRMRLRRTRGWKSSTASQEMKARPSILKANSC